jgi:energy-coupling factor transporter ATP-binding protein EcfA2
MSTTPAASQIPTRKPILAWLRIIRHPRMAEPAELRFSPGHNHVLGKNGVGKTTLLSLVSAILRDDLTAVPSPEGPIEFSFSIRARYANRGVPPGVTDWTMHVYLPARRRGEPLDDPAGTGSSPRTWSVTGSVTCTSQDVGDGVPPSELFRVTFQVSPNSWTMEPGLLAYQRESPTPIPSVLAPHFRHRVGDLVSRLFWPGPQHESQPPVFRVDFVHYLGHFIIGNPLRFDESLDYFAAITAESVAQGTGPFVGVLEFGTGRRYENTPFEIGHALFDGLVSPSQPGAIGKERSPLLSRLTEMLEAEDVLVRPRLHHRTPTGESEFRGFDFEVRWPNGAVHAHDALSFGQKRMLAFLWYLGANPELPIVADELTNGLHADWTYAIAELMEGRQVFVAAQNPMAIDAFEPPLTSADAETSLILCGRQQRGWTWRNPSTEESSRLIRAWNVGLQQLSELLRSQGLW